MVEKTKNLHIPLKVHKELKKLCAEKETSMKEYVKLILMKELGIKEV